MVKNHLKRLVAPRCWTLKRKGIKFTIKPTAGGQKKDLSMPMTVILRDVLNIAGTRRDVKRLLATKEIIVDGKRRKDDSYPIGLMDVLEIKDTKKFYRFLLNKKGKLVPVEIDATKAKIKPCKIIGKTKLKGGKTQLNLFDGKNILVDKDEYSVGGSIVLDISTGKIIEYHNLEKGTFVFLTSGKHIGDHGTVEDIKAGKVLYKDDATKELKETSKEYCFIIGKGKSEIKLEKD